MINNQGALEQPAPSERENQADSPRLSEWTSLQVNGNKNAYFDFMRRLLGSPPCFLLSHNSQSIQLSKAFSPSLSLVKPSLICTPRRHTRVCVHVYAYLPVFLFSAWSAVQ